MRLLFKQVLQSVALGTVIPALFFSAIAKRYTDDSSEMPLAVDTSVQITVLGEDGLPQVMALEEYITGVVMGEVSPDFHEEALKAQAVAARTYTMYCIEVLKKHEVGAVCTDYRCCQAYRNPEECGTKEELRKVQEAIVATTGQVLQYDSELICATYFASSGGQTEDALEVWGENYPYLKSVVSPGEDECGYFSKQITYSPQELQDALGVTLVGSPESWFGMVTYTVGGGVDLMRIGGKLYTGVELRKLLKLRSTIVTVTPTDTAIILDTKGYGHRVGMSQNGANAMALAGYGYEEILDHYYTDVTLNQIKPTQESPNQEDSD